MAIVQRVDTSTICWINQYTLNNSIGFVSTYLMNHG